MKIESDSPNIFIVYCLFFSAHIIPFSIRKFILLKNLLWYIDIQFPSRIVFHSNTGLRWNILYIFFMCSFYCMVDFDFGCRENWKIRKGSQVAWEKLKFSEFINSSTIFKNFHEYKISLLKSGTGTEPEPELKNLEPEPNIENRNPTERNRRVLLLSFTERGTYYNIRTFPSCVIALFQFLGST